MRPVDSKFKNARDFYSYYVNLDDQQRADIFDHYSEQIINTINSIDDFSLINILLERDSERRSYLYERVKPRLRSFIRNAAAKELHRVLLWLTPEKCNEFISYLSDDLAKSINSVDDFVLINKILIDKEGRKKFFEIIQSKLTSVIQDAHDLSIVLEKLEPIQRIDFILYFEEKLPSIIYSVHDFFTITECLDAEQSRDVLKKFGFYSFYNNLEPEIRRDTFIKYKEKLVSLVDGVYAFIVITKDLTPKQILYVFDKIKHRLSSFIHSVSDLTIFLEQLESEQRSYVIANFRETIASIAHSTEEFSVLSEHLSPQEWNELFSHNQFEGTIPVKDCLPGPSGRSKRKVVEAGCQFSWDDVDEFNEEKEKPREFGEIKINSEKFISSLTKSSSETKHEQLLQLADKSVVTGAAKDKVNNSVKHQKTLKYLNRAGRVSGGAMYGMMAKNIFSDAFQGDYKGVSINLGFIAGGKVFEKIAEKAAIKGTKLILNNRRLLGQSLKMASSFLKRGTSVYIVYDLFNQIKAYQQGNPDAVVGILGDNVYLAVDGAEIGIEIAEGLGFLEGVSSVTGPIGAAIGAVVFIGTDIYLAIKQVDKIDALIHLTATEKFIESLRAFVGMSPESYIQILMEENQANNRLFEQGIDFLKNHTSIQRTILPTANVIEVCNTITYKADCPDIALCYTLSHRALCSPLDFVGCQYDLFGHYFKYQTREECTSKLDIYLDNIVLLDKKKNDIHWSRTKPDAVEGRLFCAPVGDDVSIPSDGAYFCDKAIGIEYADFRTGNATFINLGDGKDRVVGFPYGDHVVILGNGHKRYHLGEGNDTFLLKGNKITGVLSGGGGKNTLDLGAFAKEQKGIMVNFKKTRGFIYFKEQSKKRLIPLRVYKINNILLRENKPDRVYSGCHTHYIDARGGENQDNSDIIITRNKQCEYAINLIIRPYTKIFNRAKNSNSQFTYSLPIANKGEAAVHIREEGGSHRFVFAYALNDIHRLEKINNTLSLVFIEDQIDTRLINENNRYTLENKFTLHISQYASNSLLLQLSDNAEIKVDGNNFYVFQYTNRPVDDIISEYSRVANYLKLTIFVQSFPSNETIAIGHGKHDVLPSDPYRRSHLVGNGGENIFTIRSVDKILDVHQLPLPEVVIYDKDDENLIDTLDLREISHLMQKELGLNIQARTMLLGDDVAIELFVSTQGIDRLISTIRLKDAVLTKWTNRLHIILNHAQMKLDAAWVLKSIPLKFDGDEDIIVIHSEDVEENTTIAITKKAGDYHFYRLEDNLLISNALNSHITDSERYTVALQAFYQTPKLETLSIVFEDKAITLKREIAEIKNATMLKDQITQYRQDKNSLLFNKTLTHSVLHLRRRREAKNSVSHSAISLCGTIRNQFFKSTLPKIEQNANHHIPLLKRFEPLQFDGSGLLLLIANLVGCKLAPVPTEENDPRFYSEDFVLKALQKKF